MAIGASRPNPGSLPHTQPRPGAGAPIPHDPRQQTITPQEVEAKINEALAQDVDTLAEEAEVLSRAHQILHEALQ